MNDITLYDVHNERPLPHHDVFRDGFVLISYENASLCLSQFNRVVPLHAFVLLVFKSHFGVKALVS
jgi:hypothetical protein